MCSIVSDCGPINGLLARHGPDISPLPRPSDQTRCAVWRENIARELPDSCPSPPAPPAPHPAETGDDDFDLQTLYRSPSYLFTLDNALGSALIKAQRLEQSAEGCLDRRRLKRIKIEKELYDSISHEAGGELRAADVNAEWARGIRRLAGSVSARAREYEHVPSDRLDGGEMSVSDASDFNSEVEMHSIASECGPTNDSLAPHDPDIFPLAKSSNQTRCPVWRENITRELPVSCPSPLASNPVKTGGDLDSQMPHPSPQPCLSALDSDLGFALVKAQRLERIAEKCLVLRRLKRIKAEKEFYDSISHEAGRRLHAADINVGVARCVRRLAGGATGKAREYVDSDGLGGSEMSVSDDSDSM